MFSMESFSDWLLNELKQREMSQSDLARLAKIGTGTISNIMSGNRKVGLHQLCNPASTTSSAKKARTTWRSATSKPPRYNPPNSPLPSNSNAASNASSPFLTARMNPQKKNSFAPTSPTSTSNVKETPSKARSTTTSHPTMTMMQSREMIHPPQQMIMCHYPAAPWGRHL